MIKIIFMFSVMTSSICLAKMTKCQTFVVEHLECVSEASLESNISLEIKNNICDSILENKIEKHHCSKL